MFNSPPTCCIYPATQNLSNNPVWRCFLWSMFKNYWNYMYLLFRTRIPSSGLFSLKAGFIVWHVTTRPREFCLQTGNSKNYSSLWCNISFRRMQSWSVKNACDFTEILQNPKEVENEQLVTNCQSQWNCNFWHIEMWLSYSWWSAHPSKPQINNCYHYRAVISCDWPLLK